ncbi:MAG: heme lyase CcmF/NrfE family subunit [Planctomycetaceae bacterium]|nr:heme lyase CcmF/NrfE family subunit [Planctomycetaceae bacterium]
MRTAGELCLLVAFVCSAWAGLACLAGAFRQQPSLMKGGRWASGICLTAITAAMLILVSALWKKDFTFAYVAQYSSRLLPWYYSVSALWVGQAGSLLLWTWLQAVLAMIFQIPVRHRTSQLHQAAFGGIMLYVCFLICAMVFGVNPLERNIAVAEDGLGLSPLLQHPAMLIHPPVVFLAYAAWTIPAALAISVVSLARAARNSSESPNPHLNPDAPADQDILPLSLPSGHSAVSSEWLNAARPWALFAWMVLGAGILLGANWSYEELGWGGYWAWDPVENGSLLPWLTGTVFLHGLMAWRLRGILKKSTLVMALTTFALCNFATFLTRSGIFSSLHAFSQSPIGWLFLGLMVVITLTGLHGVIRSRRLLAPERSITHVFSCESQVLISGVALLLLSVIVLVGTLSAALSEPLIGRRIMLGTGFYNSVLLPIGLTLLATMAFAPLLRWGRGPTSTQKKGIRAASVTALLVTVAAVPAGIRHPTAVAVVGLIALVLASLGIAFQMDVQRAGSASLINRMVHVLKARRRQYTGFLMHLGFVCLVIGVTGSSIGHRRDDVVLGPGETVEFSGRTVRFVRLHEQDTEDRFIAAAELQIADTDGTTFTLLPAQHLHHLQDEWTTEVAIHSSWTRDFYTILLNGESDGAVRLVLIENPLMRWLWLGGFVMAAGTISALWPEKRRGVMEAQIHPVEQTSAISADRSPLPRLTSLKKGA